MRFGDSTEIQYLDEPPELGSRIRSDSGEEWFVAEALQSGRRTYTVWCVGGDELLADPGTGPSRGRALAEDLVALARRSVRTSRAAEVAEGDAEAGRDAAGGVRNLRPYVAVVVDSEGRPRRYLIEAPSPAAAEREVLEGAREWGLTLIDIRLHDEPPARPRRPRGPAQWAQSLLRRGIGSTERSRRRRRS